MEAEKRYLFWVIGGDARQPALARALMDDGHFVHTFALERGGDGLPHAGALSGIEAAHCVVLPLPADDGEQVRAPLSGLRLPVERLMEALRPGQLVCAGRPSEALKTAAAGRGVTLTDYGAQEELACANAVPSSEGAIQLAMEELPITLHGARVLVVGFGRIGSVLARQLTGLGARVCVAARRREQLTWAGIWGYDTDHSDGLAGRLGSYDLVLNTVPAPVLGWEALRSLRKEGLIIDLASAPGGVDQEAAQALGVRVIHAPGLPGKVAPVTAAGAVKDALYNILSQSGV